MATSIRFPRELLKWLQSLNITSSIKNVKFDFGNGYVVAEILNRYYPSDVRLNSFDTGQSKNCRKENWQLLKRMFNKFNIQVAESDINELINTRMSSGETAVRIISTLYSFFLKKNIKPPKSSSYIKKKDISSYNIEDNIQIENNKEAMKLMLIENQKSDDINNKKEEIKTNSNIHLLEYIFNLFGYKGQKKIFDKSFLDINNLSIIFLDMIDKSPNDKIQKAIEEFKCNQNKIIDLVQHSHTDDIIFLIQLFSHILSIKTIQKKSFKVSVIIIPIVFSAIKKSIGIEGIKLLFNSNSYDEIINGMTIEKIPFFSRCIESLTNGSPIEEKQIQDIYDKIKQSLCKININYELAFITTISIIDPKHAYFHINSILTHLNSSNSDTIDYSTILHYLSILIPTTSTDFILPLLRKFNILKSTVQNKLDLLKDLNINNNENTYNGLIRSWIRFLIVIIEVLAETSSSNLKIKTNKNKNSDKNNSNDKNKSNNNNNNNILNSRASSPDNTTRSMNQKEFIQKKKNIISNNTFSIELPNGEIIDLPPSLNEINIDEIYSPIIFCQEIVNEAMNEIIELLPKLNYENLKIALFLLAPNITVYTSLSQEFVNNSLRLPLVELQEIIPMNTYIDKTISFDINWKVPYFNSPDKMPCFKVNDSWRFCYCMGFINLMKGKENHYYYDYLEYFIRQSNHPMPIIMENVLVAIANDDNQLKYGLSILEHLTFTDDHLLKLLTTVLYILEYGSNETSIALKKWLLYKNTEEEKMHMNKIKKWINNEVNKILN